MITVFRIKLFITGLLLSGICSSAQDKEAQYPGVLKKAYAGFQMGYINTPFSNNNLEPGFQAGKINIPHLGVRIIAGYRISDHLSAQMSFMRPGPWAVYENINGDNKRHGVWMTIGGLTLKPQFFLNRSFSIYGEAGYGLITRHGFTIDQSTPITDASYSSILLGGGMQYHLDKNWDISLNTIFNPANKKQNHPGTSLIAAGFTYKLNPLPDEKVKHNAGGGYAFPDHMIQLGISSNIAGYEANKFFSTKVPIFWAGQIEAKYGFVLTYQRDVFHTRKIFSLNWGVDISFWKTVQGTDFYSIAVFPMFRFTLLRTKPVDGYLQYSVAGPAFISKRFIDGFDTGRKFTFQDLMGMGFLTGQKKNISIEFMLGHYSNGNIFPRNAGIKLPLQLNLGYAFDK
jgi:opacity protein-like surface antigen